VQFRRELACTFKVYVDLHLEGGGQAATRGGGCVVRWGVVCVTIGFLASSSSGTGACIPALMGMNEPPRVENQGEQEEELEKVGVANRQKNGRHYHG